jgi:hypothetical protein
LKSKPGHSVPRQCADQYTRARDRLLEQPAQRSAWEDFADLCESLQRQLDEYRKKPGSDVSGQVSFRAEAQFARDLLDGDSLDRLEAIAGP